jgi:drug/metabolite transporter (DMT)-like permease
MSAAPPAPTAARDRRHLAYLLLAAAPAMWSANMIVARWAAPWFPPHQLAFWRWLVALAPMLAIAGVTLWTQRADLRREWRDLLVLGALGMWVCGAFVYIGGRTTTATNIGLIYAGVPILIMLVSAAFFRERLGPPQVVGAVVALVGVLAIVTQGDPGVFARLDFTAGDLWILAAASAWAVYSLMLRYRRTALAPFPRLAAITIGGVCVLAPLALVEAVVAGTPAFDGRTLVAVLIVALLPGFGAYQAWSWLLREIGPSRTGLILYLTPIYNALLAWLILGEAVRWYHAAGGMLVLGGVYLASRGAARPAR